MSRGQNAVGVIAGQASGPSAPSAVNSQAGSGSGPRSVRKVAVPSSTAVIRRVGCPARGGAVVMAWRACGAVSVGSSAGPSGSVTVTVGGGDGGGAAVN
ncbi:MAG: hypothetical protein ACRDS0_00365 [Pseudonocardiaceae bacterium]